MSDRETSHASGAARAGLILRAGLWMADRGMVPDALLRRGIRRLCAERLRDSVPDDAARRTALRDDFLRDRRSGPIAVATDAANEQHYEVPASFYRHCLGLHRKYSGCFWPSGTAGLDEAEAAALAETCAHAVLRDGHRILELGCGWGSLTLWIAERYPAAHITGVSNSTSQRRYILAEAERRGLDNVDIVTCDINRFDTDNRFDRIVSVEMFEHMRNYERLLTNCMGWLKPDGQMLVHVFCHQDVGYAFETEGAGNWMGQYFFTGGIMPPADIFDAFPEIVSVVDQWTWDGTHYARTAEAWLANLDQHRDILMPILAQTYGPDQARTWFHRWRIFFLACAETFAFHAGQEWVVTHTLMRPAEKHT